MLLQLFLLGIMLVHEHRVLPGSFSDLLQSLLHVVGGRRRSLQFHSVHLAQLAAALLHGPLFRVKGLKVGNREVGLTLTQKAIDVVNISMAGKGKKYCYRLYCKLNK